jgi:predicted DNA-binding transcriptional regulator AlpA
MSHHDTLTETLLTPEQAADFLQISLRTLERWRSDGQGPPVCGLTARTLRYARSDLLAWCAEHRRGETAAA